MAKYGHKSVPISKSATADAFNLKSRTKAQVASGAEPSSFESGARELLAVYQQRSGGR